MNSKRNKIIFINYEIPQKILGFENNDIHVCSTAEENIDVQYPRKPLAFLNSNVNTQDTASNDYSYITSSASVLLSI